MELACSMTECPLVEKRADTMTDAIELMKFHMFSEHGQGGSSCKKMECPQISEELTDKDWETFVDNWERYKASQNLKGTAEVRTELLNCYHKEVRQSLKQSRGVKTEKLSEADLLTRIKRHAVISSHVSVHRKNFNNMRQEENEIFNHWVTRLPAKMNMCKYRIPCNLANCNHDHNYGEILVEEAMIANMYDQESMTRIMSDLETTNTY